MPSFSSRFALWSFVTVILLAMGLRILSCVIFASDLENDRDLYLGLARNLERGVGFCTPSTEFPTAFRPPLYPLVLSIFDVALGGSLGVASLNVLAGTGTVWLTVSLGQRLQLSSGASLIAGLLVAVDPLLIAYCSQPMTEVLATCLSMASLWVISSRHREPSWKGQFLAGLVLGLCALCRPTFLLWGGLLFVVWGLKAVRKTRPIQNLAFMLMGIGLAVAPWGIRNVLVMGAPILTTTHGGYTLFLGNNSVFYRDVVQDGLSAEWPTVSFQAWEADWQNQVQESPIPIRTERDLDRWFSEQAWRTIQQNPGLFIRACGLRQMQLWAICPPSATGNRKWPVMLFYGSEFFFALIGVWCIGTSRDRSRWIPAGLLVVSVVGAHLFYWTNTRMRAPFQPVIAIVAAVGMTGFMRKLPSRQVVFSSDPLETGQQRK